MVQFLSLVVAGAIAGGLYGMMASGLVLTYQASGIFNLAHGAVAFVAALAFYVLHQPSASGGVGLAVVPAALLAVGVVAPAVGLALDAAVFRRLAHAPETARLVGTIGVLIALPAAALLTVEAINAFGGTHLPNAAGDQGVAPPGLGPSPAMRWSLTTGVSVTSDQVAVVVTAGLVAVGLWFMLRHTRFGLETRAGVDRPALARLRGIDTDHSSRLVWVLTSTLAGLAGILIAPLFDLSAITFDMIVFISFTAAVAARLRSVPLAFVGGVVLGIVQNLVNGYAPDALSKISGFRSAVPFILLFLLMFLLPSRGRAAGSVSEEVPPTDPRSDLPTWRRWLPWIVTTLVLGGYFMWVADAYWRGVVIRGLVFGLVFLSFVVVTGLGGMINLAQATFVTAGGFTAGWLVNHQWPSTVPVVMNNGRLELWVAVLAAMAVTALVGLFVAIPSMRLGGLSLALATLALAFVGDRLVFQLEGIRNGSRGWSIARPSYGPIDLGDDRTLFVVLVVLIVLVIGVIANLHRSATGRAVLAVRSSEVAASTSGVHPVRTKMIVFAVSAALAGLGGAVFGMVNSPITNTSVPPLLGIVWLAVAVTFGIRRPGGAVLAGMVYSVFPVILAGIGSTWKGAPWASLPDAVRQVMGNQALAAMFFGLGAVSLAREPDGVLAGVGSWLRGLRDARGGGESVVVPAAPGATGQVVGRDAMPTEVTEPSVGEPILLVEGLRAGYGDVEVLHGVELRVGAGTVLCLFGANGAGKTTLASVIGGLIMPSEGRILLDGVDMTTSAPHRRARAGLLVAPEARGVFPALSVQDNLSVRLRTAEAREAAYDRFPILGERRDQQAGLLSGGEQQQLALASALADPPRLFLADEPTLGLSPMTTETVFDALCELRSMGVAMVLIEEQAAAALEVADTVAVLDRGRVGWQGPAAEVDADRLADSYLGTSALIT